ncbi:uncharacterized protein O3Q21_008422 isoform 1-T7 [Podargus strigoides]
MCRRHCGSTPPSTPASRTPGMRITGRTTCSVEHCGSTLPSTPASRTPGMRITGRTTCSVEMGGLFGEIVGTGTIKGLGAPWRGGGFALPDWDLGPQHGLELGIPSPAPRLSRRNIAGSLVVVVPSIIKGRQAASDEAALLTGGSSYFKAQKDASIVPGSPSS